MKIFNKVSNLVAAGIMIFFSIPKLTGDEDAINGFAQFESFVPIDINVFRIFAGVAELFIGILLIAYTIKNKENLGKIAYSLLLVTMLSAIVLEFFARPEPEAVLAAIAIFLSGLSMYKLKTLLVK